MWLDDDQDKVHAWLLTRAEVCPQCGTTEDDWVDADKVWLDPPKWEPVPFRCHGCDEMQRVADAIPKGERGVRVVLLPFNPDRTLFDYGPAREATLDGGFD